MLNHRVAAVTGATGAIGEAIARQLVSAEFEVVLICRDQNKAARVRDRIVRTTARELVRIEIVDVSRAAEVLALAARWRGPLHVLVNNAAIAPRSRQETSDGLEVQFATNVLGYFWMIEDLREVLKQSAPARVVNVASYWAGGLAIDDLEFKRRRYDNDAAYRQSKQANRMLTVAHAERLAADGITVNVCHPGDVNSTLSNSLGFGGHESPDQGADTPVWLATNPALAKQTGKYFEHRSQSVCRFAADRDAVEALYRACARVSS
jgi:NAD(P)-dependent dehydrogenase (short-subunit alcohol dehydrogenase family)